MKKVLFSLIFLFLPLMLVKATTISDISMDIYLDNNGDATVTETWQANVTQGTEGYHPYFNLGNSDIMLLSATMDGKAYKIINDWDINSSLSEKANKAGIYRTGDELDLCFGVTSYGRHTYEIKYKISNFILSLTDADMAYWQLFPYDFSAEPERVYIKIHSDFRYADTLDVWGYGNLGGTAYVYDGYIEMQSKGTLDSNEYMTILIKFPKGTFNTLNTSSENFDYYYKMAEEGTTHYTDNSTNKNILSIIIGIITSLIWPIIVLFFIVKVVFSKTDNYDFGSTGNRINDTVPNFRDIPCNKDIYRAYFIAQKYNLNKTKEDLLGAILLKWLKNGNVRVEKVEEKYLFKTETLDNIIFINPPTEIDLESKLYEWMYEASKDGKLESNEFKKWCKNNYSKILKWFDEVIDYERDILITEGKITTKESDSKMFKRIIYVVDPKMYLEACQMKGLKNYLKEFTLIKEREPIEVQLWNEYLMYAQIFGIAKEVAEQFKKLYPEITDNMTQSGFDYNDMMFLYVISHDGMTSASLAQTRAQSYSSGGGGFSSGGGGGGSFGGGGGGGGFR